MKSYKDYNYIRVRVSDEEMQKVESLIRSGVAKTQAAAIHALAFKERKTKKESFSMNKEEVFCNYINRVNEIRDEVDKIANAEIKNKVIYMGDIYELQHMLDEMSTIGEDMLMG